MRISDMAFASGRGWKIRGHDGASRTFDLVIVAAGPWSGEIAAKLGYDVPMFWERGYHQHLEPGQGAAMGRPVHVVDEGRAEERGGGTECVRPCRYRWSPEH